VSDEVQLLDAAWACDSAAFGQLVDPFRGEVQAHCYRMRGSLHDAEDAVQEALVRAWRGLDKFENRGSIVCGSTRSPRTGASRCCWKPSAGRSGWPPGTLRRTAATRRSCRSPSQYSSGHIVPIAGERGVAPPTGRWRRPRHTTASPRDIPLLAEITSCEHERGKRGTYGWRPPREGVDRLPNLPRRRPLAPPRGGRLSGRATRRTG
jgi:hypothetical protein